MMEKHFKAYKDVTNRIQTKNMQLIKMKEDWYNLTGVKISDMPKGGKSIDMADQLHNIVEKEKELKALIDYKEELRRIHEKEIDVINNNKKRTTLKLFYLDSCSIKQIAYCLGISESYAKKLKRWAVEEFIRKIIK